jgi:cell division protein FtsB
MRKAYKNLLLKYPLLAKIGLKYIFATVFFIVWILFLDSYSYFEQRALNKQINALEDNKTYYKTEISKDEQSIKNLKNPSQIEKYARETYFMKRDSEDVYIIDIEEDRIKDSLLEAQKN